MGEEHGVPQEIGGLSNLMEIILAFNSLRGTIPATMFNISTLQRDLHPINFQDHCHYIRAIHQLANLEGIYLANNSFTGILPYSISNDSKLTILDVGYNNFSGIVPNSLDLSYNNFFGDVTDNIGDLQHLVRLSLEHNDLVGTIPETFQSLVSLETLDLSQNNLSGVIPKSLDTVLLHLKYFNVSYNKLHGEIPSGGSFGNFTSQSFLPNGALCGATQFGIRPCKTNSIDRLKSLRKVVIICVSSAISLVVLLLTFILLWIRCQKSKRLPVEVDLHPVAEHCRISYREILEATNGFEESNLLVFRLQQERALKSFHVEYDIIRNVRHRNLIKIITSCSNTDFKALVLEYMPNGSSEKWLYSHNYVLDILQRLDIMIDLACALDYLHHEYGLRGSVSTSCDVYIYGILLMETFTRKKPTDEMFAGQMTIKCWVKESLPSAVIQVLDRNLLMQGSENSLAEVDCVSYILKLALDCAAESPQQRINMKARHRQTSNTGHTPAEPSITNVVTGDLSQNQEQAITGAPQCHHHRIKAEIGRISTGVDLSSAHRDTI
ncbi:LOW QUALITY PROTEIN: hypothetical protein RJ640_025502 [Escallonia rubra]|uniref:Serine-threonine/tyrosine-protein kinase catalytic domain-containing protein n=1 Tax=Escallonia rubra TaxID=112253 RepID=A0AA88QD95_9ASTE|nr:LOW QUALITY PROTEIN: hypothetical protein RJ640_025502 [Escallonia rubra]